MINSAVTHEYVGIGLGLGDVHLIPIEEWAKLAKWSITDLIVGFGRVFSIGVLGSDLIATWAECHACRSGM